ELVHKVAEAGYELFMTIFFPEGSFPEDDPRAELRKVFAILTQHLHEKERWIRIESDDFFAPWNLLYSRKPPKRGEPIDPSGFWGYQHVVEHVTPGSGDLAFTPSSNSDDPLRFGLHLDTNLDTEFELEVLSPVTEFLDSRDSRQLERRERFSRPV